MYQRKDLTSVDEVLAAANSRAHVVLAKYPAGIASAPEASDELTLRFLAASRGMPPHEVGQNWHLCFETWEIIQLALSGNPWAYEHAIRCAACTPHLLPYLHD